MELNSSPIPTNKISTSYQLDFDLEKANKEFFQRLKNSISSNNAKFPLLVTGIESSESREDDESDEGDDVDSKKLLTLEQLNSLRYILITKRRDSAMNSGDKFASCGQHKSNVQMFNTSTGNRVISGIPKEIKKSFNKKTLPEKFDALFGLTYGLDYYDSWMSDNECWGDGGDLDKAIQLLGQAWKNLLKNDNAKLGIDQEFTRPGIEEFLKKFSEKVDQCEAIETSFDWE